MFHFIASTGRTATTFLASCLNQFNGVVACHEGYVGSEKDSEPLLPLINLENMSCFNKPSMALGIVEKKRGQDILQTALAQVGSDVLIDVAYYNATIATGILNHHENAKMVGIIRGCEAFVKSAACISGEDPLPVGWPDPHKPLSEREKFISLGRIRPAKGTEDAGLWKDWGTIERNIWLWKETNGLILRAREQFPNRVRVVRFEQLKEDKAEFWHSLLTHFGINEPADLEELVRQSQGHQNRKPTGYQIPDADQWEPAQRALLSRAQLEIERNLLL